MKPLLGRWAAGRAFGYRVCQNSKFTLKNGLSILIPAACGDPAGNPGAGAVADGRERQVPAAGRGSAPACAHACARVKASMLHFAWRGCLVRFVCLTCRSLCGRDPTTRGSPLPWMAARLLGSLERFS